MNRAKRSLAALATAVLLAGYALAGVYWYGKISWSPSHLLYEAPVPGWNNFFRMDAGRHLLDLPRRCHRSWAAPPGWQGIQRSALLPSPSLTV